MSDTQKTHAETIADIIAEMRGMGNYQRYSGDHARVLAGRLEAAHKRERGDMAKLREALEYVQEKLYVDCNGEVYIYANEVKRISDKINAALATPARNCDKVKDHSDAIEKFEKWMDSSPKTADEQDAFFKEHWFEFAMWLIDMNESEAEK